MIKIATWNVNSVRPRLQHLLAFLREEQPDITLLQELKCTEDQFPYMEIEELGYNIAAYGEKTYNGVAILSKFPLDDVSRGLAGDDGDTHARYIEAVVCHPQLVLRVASVYVPNGQDAACDKFPYKLKFLDRLASHLQKLLAYQEVLVIGGDYNIAPSDADVHDPKGWEGSVLTHDEVRRKFHAITNLGIYDAATLPAANNGSEADYTWWDYRGGGFAMNNGLRIDHHLLSPQAADRICGYCVNKKFRELEKPSDHAPVVLEISVG